MQETIRQSLHFRDAYITDKRLLFSAVEVNGLFCRKKNKTTAEFLSLFPGENEWQSNLHSQIIEYENRLYFIPLNGKGISICNLYDMGLETIPYEEGRTIEIIRAFLVDTDILLLPLHIGTPFLIFHTKDKTYEKWSDIEVVLEQEIKRENIWLDTFSAAMEDKVLYLALPDTDIMVQYDLNKRDAVLTRLGDGLRLSAIACIGRKTFISARNCPDIIVYDMKTKGIGKIRKRGIAVEDEGENLVLSNKDVLYAVSSGNIEVLHQDNNGSGRISIPGQFFEQTNQYRLFAGVRRLGDNLWIFSASGGGTLYLRDNRVDFLETFAPPDITDKRMRYQAIRLKLEIKRKGYVIENQDREAGLCNLISLAQYEKENEKASNVAKQIGYDIWKYIK